MVDQVNAAIEASSSLGEVLSIHRMSKAGVMMHAFALLIALMFIGLGWGINPAQDTPQTVTGRWQTVLICGLIGLALLTFAGLNGERPRLTTFGGLATPARYAALWGCQAIIIGAIMAERSLTPFGLGLDFLLCIALPGLWRYFTGRDGLAIVCRDGFSYTFEGRTTLFPWANIQGPKIRRGKHNEYITFRRRDDREFAFDGAPIRRRSSALPETLTFRNFAGGRFTFADPWLEDYGRLLHTIVVEVERASGMQSSDARVRDSIRLSAPPRTLLQVRVNSIAEASASLGEVLSIHAAAWYAPLRSAALAFLGILLIWVGAASVSGADTAAWPTSTMLFISVGVVGFSGITALAALIGGRFPRLTLPALHTQTDVIACLAGHGLLILPFCLATLLNGPWLIAGIGVDLTACAALGIWRWARCRDGLAVLFEYGFSFSFDGELTVLSWDDIDQLTIGRGGYAPLLYIRTRRGERLTFSGADLDNAHGLFQVIAETVYQSQRLAAPALR